MLPRPKLTVRKPQRNVYATPRLNADLTFDYGGQVVPHHDPGRGVYQQDERRFVRRDLAAEQAALQRLHSLGVRKAPYYGEPNTFELKLNDLPKLVRHLVPEGWQVEAEGKLYRQPGWLNPGS